MQLNLNQHFYVEYLFSWRLLYYLTKELSANWLLLLFVRNNYKSGLVENLKIEGLYVLP